MLPPFPNIANRPKPPDPMKTAALALVILSLLTAVSFAQAENPVQRTLQRTMPEAEIREAKAEIVPLFWKAKLDESTILLPLRSIEFFGVQNYDVDGATRVRELTISTDSHNLIRIYHIRPLDAAGKATNHVETLRRLAEGTTGEEFDRPVKVFPQTTHAHMVEYRVEEESHVDSLYQHLEALMIDYQARDIVAEQRPETVREIKIAD